VVRETRATEVGENDFYIKEALLKFEFAKDTCNAFKIITYNNQGKDAKWTKVK
jgi:hypothetical protein